MSFNESQAVLRSPSVSRTQSKDLTVEIKSLLSRLTDSEDCEEQVLVRGKTLSNVTTHSHLEYDNGLNSHHVVMIKVKHFLVITDHRLRCGE